MWSQWGTWGGLVTFLYPPDFLHQLFVVLILEYIASGVVTSLSAMNDVFLAFFLPMQKTSVARWMISSSPDSSEGIH